MGETVDPRKCYPAAPTGSSLPEQSPSTALYQVVRPPTPTAGVGEKSDSRGLSVLCHGRHNSSTGRHRLATSYLSTCQEDGGCWHTNLEPGLEVAQGRCVTSTHLAVARSAINSMNSVIVDGHLGAHAGHTAPLGHHPPSVHFPGDRLPSRVAFISIPE